MSHGDFDERNWDSWYYKSLNLEQSTSMLREEDIGVFLVRKSNQTKDGYVVCVKEKDGVAQYKINCKDVNNETHYYIREESSFPDVPSLLSFYKRNLFKTTPLIRPYNTKPSTKHVDHRHTVDGVPGNKASSQSKCVRNSDPGGIGEKEDLEPPCYVRVTKMKIPSPYQVRELQLSIGDVIKVTKRCQSGQWEGEINGKWGVFPFTHVEMLPEYTS